MIRNFNKYLFASISTDTGQSRPLDKQTFRKTFPPLLCLFLFIIFFAPFLLIKAPTFTTRIHFLSLNLNLVENGKYLEEKLDLSASLLENFPVLKSCYIKTFTHNAFNSLWASISYLHEYTFKPPTTNAFSALPRTSTTNIKIYTKNILKVLFQNSHFPFFPWRHLKEGFGMGPCYIWNVFSAIQNAI